MIMQNKNDMRWYRKEGKWKNYQGSRWGIRYGDIGWYKTYLQQLISYTSNGIILCYSKIRQHVVMSNMWSNCITVLILCPFVFRHVRMTGSNIFRLNLIPTFVDWKTICCHDETKREKLWKQEGNGGFFFFFPTAGMPVFPFTTASRILFIMIFDIRHFPEFWLTFMVWMTC